jgi:hypothetical protein
MAKWLTLICLALGVVALSANAFAGANAAHKLAIHVKAHPTSCTVNYPEFAVCSQIVTTWTGFGDVDVMPVFFDLAAYTLNETGLIWPEASWGSGSWVRCRGDLAVGTIQHSADQAGFDPQTRGTAISWSTCQLSPASAPGYCWLTVNSPGLVWPEANPVSGDCGVVDCAAAPGPYYDWPIAAHCAGIGGMIGDDPCMPVAGEPGTWGGIKSIFR